MLSPPFAASLPPTSSFSLPSSMQGLPLVNIVADLASLSSVPAHSLGGAGAPLMLPVESAAADGRVGSFSGRMAVPTPDMLERWGIDRLAGDVLHEWDVSASTHSMLGMPHSLDAPSAALLASASSAAAFSAAAAGSDVSSSSSSSSAASALARLVFDSTVAALIATESNALVYYETRVASSSSSSSDLSLQIAGRVALPFNIQNPNHRAAQRQRDLLIAERLRQRERMHQELLQSPQGILQQQPQPEQVVVGRSVGSLARQYAQSRQAAIGAASAEAEVPDGVAGNVADQQQAQQQPQQPRVVGGGSVAWWARRYVLSRQPVVVAAAGPAAAVPVDVAGEGDSEDAENAPNGL